MEGGLNENLHFEWWMHSPHDKFICQSSQKQWEARLGNFLWKIVDENSLKILSSSVVLAPLESWDKELDFPQDGK